MIVIAVIVVRAAAPGPALARTHACTPDVIEVSIHSCIINRMYIMSCSVIVSCIVVYWLNMCINFT